MGFSYGVKFAVPYDLGKVIGGNAHILAHCCYIQIDMLQREIPELVSYITELMCDLAQLYPTEKINKCFSPSAKPI